MKNVLMVTVVISLAGCAHQPAVLIAPADLSAQNLSTVPARLGDAHAFTADGLRWWSNGMRWWSNSTQWWSDGLRWWSHGLRWWSHGTFLPLPDNSESFRVIGLHDVQDLAPRMGEGVIVAVIDTGVDVQHPMLHDALLPGFDYVDGHAGAVDAGSDADLAYGHGTVVAGLIRQVAPGALILPMRVLSQDGSGTDSHVAQAIRDAVAQGARVINLSIGTAAPSGGVRAAIVDAAKRGVMIVGASGNDGGQRPQSPAWQMSTPDLAGSMSLSVGATDQEGAEVSWSSRGSEVVAPGVNLTSAFPGGRLVDATGTSFSAPLVSGALALALAEGASEAHLTDALVRSSQQGRLDVAEFLRQVR